MRTLSFVARILVSFTADIRVYSGAESYANVEKRTIIREKKKHDRKTQHV